ncbi:MAG: NAD(P)/FAD-dependent oxidoreductase [Kiloniellales bacterium]
MTLSARPALERLEREAARLSLDDAPAGAPEAPSRAERRRPHVVILGAGFGGLAAAKTLARAPVEVTVLDRRNYHLFQPLLYQVATAGLSPADIASPIRSILRYQKNVRVLLGRVTAIDKEAREVDLGDRRVPYDALIVATGARHAYFGHDNWEAFAPGLKKIEDATEIRRRILSAFEQAEIALDEGERRRLLNFVVIGGGPTGVEMAGAIAELAKVALAQDFRVIDPKEARILLVEAGPRILPAFPERLSSVAVRSLEKLGVEVRCGKAVTACDETGVTLGDERIESGCVIWAAGVMASPAAKWLAAEKDRAGRVIVGRDLSLPGHPEILVVGDTAAVTQEDGTPVPGIAPAAKQMGSYAAKRAMALLNGRSSAPFRYRHAGNLATIGRQAAVVDFGWIKLTGRLAWLLWGAAHIFFLIGFRNRFAVLLDWIWAYLTFQRGARLITGGER